MAKLPPPIEHQFKKGNKGKPKGTLNIKTRMINALLEEIEYPDLNIPSKKGEKPQNITGPVIDYIISSLITQAIKGNMKAVEILLNRTESHLESTEEKNDHVNRFELHIIDPNGHLQSEA